MNAQIHVTVAAVVERDGRFLLVEESVAGATVLNQPAGHWDEGESLFEATVRETLEESAWDVELSSLLGIYSFRPPELDYGFLRFAFAARPLRHHPGRTLDAGIERAVWMSYEEIAASRARHRSPMVLRCVEDYRAGRHFPLNLVDHLGPSPV
ncbi:MAG: NUDIX hydrolase [Nevskia sp.]|nr:NUDIX hydrolase [Nevskia sp.]